MKSKKIIHKIQSNFIWVVVFLLFLAVGFFGIKILNSIIDNSKAGFNNANSRFEDSLIIPHQIAEYSYTYRNDTGISQPAYFELFLQNISGSFPQDVLRVVGVTDTYPLDNFGNGGTANSVPLDRSVFVNGNKLYIRVSPQNPCIQRPQGGCQNATLSPGVVGKIKIQVAYKENPPANQHVFEGQGVMYFPSSTNLASTGWRIGASLQSSNFVLNSSVSPQATISGPAGVGQPLLGTNYSIVVTGIKASDGSNLQAPSGKCSTTVSNQTFEGLGINGGQCTILVSREALPTVSGGTVSINDGGNPISVSRSTDFSAKEAITNILDYKAIVDNVSEASSGDTYLVYFSLNGFTNGDSDIHTQFYFDNEPATSLDRIHSGVSPYLIPKTNVPAGATKICVVVARPDNTILENSGNCRSLVATADDSLSENGKTAINGDDIAGLTFACELAIINKTTNCDILFPSDKRLPETALRLAVGNVPLGGECKKTGDLATCEKVPIGNVPGSNLIYASIGDGEPQLTGEKAVLLDENGEGIDDAIDSDGGLSPEELQELKNLADQFGVSLDEILSEKGINVSTGSAISTNQIKTNDLSRTGAGILVTFGSVGFTIIVVIYIVSLRNQKKLIRKNTTVINTKKK